VRLVLYAGIFTIVSESTASEGKLQNRVELGAACYRSTERRAPVPMYTEYKLILQAMIDNPYTEVSIKNNCYTGKRNKRPS